jgi:arabinofuranosyltransferase
VTEPDARRASRAAVVTVAVALGALAALFAWEVSQSGPVSIDDSYITFSYSKNLAAGHGPVYGHGVRVEGYSNFLWMVVVALGLVVRRAADPMTVARVAAVPFLALLAASAYGLARDRAPRLLALAVVAVLAVSGDLVIATLIGLETVAHVALLTSAFLLYARALREPRWRRWVVPAFVAVALNRIDGFVPLAFILGFEAARRLLHREGSARDFLGWAAPGVVVYLAWFAWRWSYYGLPLPTTYYAKALIPKVLPDRGWQYVRDEVVVAGLYVAAPFALLLLARGGAAARAIVLYAAGHLAYVCRVGGDWMPYGRFVLPVVPLLLVIVAWGAAAAAALVPERWRRPALSLAVAGGLALPAFAFVVARTEPHLSAAIPQQRDKRALAAQQATHVQALKDGAALLRFAVAPGARLVTDYGGVIAYYTDAAPIEMWGLCNALIATKGTIEGINPIYGKTCPRCYVKLDPEMFHANMPMVRPLNGLASHAAVLAEVWQTNTIGQYLDFQRDFVSGRVIQPAQNRAVFFLERLRPQGRYTPRQVADGTFVDYPFLPEGRLPGT